MRLSLTGHPGQTGQEVSSASEERSSDNLLHGVWRGGIQRFGG
jgi:hypothetical protein